MERRVTHSLVNALQDVPSFASVDDRMLLALIGDSANLYWPPDGVVFERGSPADGLYIVISGRVRVVEENGATLAELGPGDFFGELSLLLGTTHQHDVVVQNGTRHAWRNKSECAATVAFVLIGAHTERSAR